MKKLFISLFFVLTFFCMSHASVTLTWQQVVDYAKENNPDIIRARLAVANAENAHKRAYSGFLPNVSLRGSMGQGERELESGNTRFTRDYTYGVYGSWELFSGFADYAAARAARRDLLAARAAYDRAISDVAYNVSAAFVNLVWAHENVALAGAILTRRRENYDMVNLKYHSGAVDLGSLKRVEADTELSVFELAKARRYVQTASAALFNAMGGHSPQIINTDVKLTVVDKLLQMPEFLSFVRDIPEYKISMYSLESAEFAFTRSRSSWYPRITATGDIRRFDQQWAPDRQAWNAALGISLPLFTGGARLFDTKTAKNNVQIASQNFQRTMYSLISKAVDFYNSVVDAYGNLIVREKYLAAASLQAEISAKKYINGLTSYQDWYSIENDYINSQRALLNARRDAILAKAQWDNFQGLGFSEPEN